jgi:hypothetical protein
MHRNNIQQRQQQKRIAQQIKDTDSTSFFNLLTSPQLLDCVEDHLPEHRERLYPPTETLAMFLSQALNTDASCQKAVNDAAIQRTVNGLSVGSVRTGGYCRARQRLPLQMVSAVTKRAGELVSSRTPATWRWKNRAVKLVDGTTVSMPDTAANQSIYPQPCSQKEHLGFPLARVVGVICLSTGVIQNAAIGPCKGKAGSEYALFLQLLDSFTSGDVMLADRYYTSYFLIILLRARGVDVVMQQHGARKTDFRRGRTLGTRDHVVHWPKPVIMPKWMSKEEYDAFPDSLAVREVKAGKKIIVTTLLSDKEASREELKTLYKQRLHIELNFRHIKTTLGMDVLRCKNPSMIEKEIWVYFLAYNLIRLLMAEASLQAGRLPCQLSFKHALQIWIAWSGRQFRGGNTENTSVLFALIGKIIIGNRAGRIEPRALKRRPKAYALLTKSRALARAEVKKHGHAKQLK